MKRKSPTLSILVFTVLAILLSTATISGAQVLTSTCLSPSVPLVVEEQRLTYTLPSNSNPAVLQSESFAQQMIEGAGWKYLGPLVVAELCKARNVKEAESIVKLNGMLLWQMAIYRAQNRFVLGSLPYSDDRPLYWTRLQVRAAIRQWIPKFTLPLDEDQASLVTTFDRASRGMFSINFPTGKHVKRLIMSGFDPYTLDGGTLSGSNIGTSTSPVYLPGPCKTFLPPNCIGDNIRHGNPSGAIALSLAGTQYKAKDGTVVYIAAYTLPVNYAEFEAGYQEDTIGPFMQPGPQQVNASVSVSQAGPFTFNVEQWNGRYHGVSIGNDNEAPCPSVLNPTPPPTRIPQLAINNEGCNIIVVPQWGGPSIFDLFDPPQWTTTSLPVAALIAANTGVGITPPPAGIGATSGDGWTGDSNAFGVIWHTPFTEFASCASVTETSVNSLSCENTTCPTPLVSGQLPPAGTPPTGWPQTPPDVNSCAYSGGGGNYLSNESAFRNTLLRDRSGLGCPGKNCIPAGHIHTPSMQVFDFGDYFNVSDATFNTWRLAIVKQAQNLIHVVADNAPKSK